MAETRRSDDEYPIRDADGEETGFFRHIGGEEGEVLDRRSSDQRERDDR